LANKFKVDRAFGNSVYVHALILCDDECLALNQKNFFYKKSKHLKSLQIFKVKNSLHLFAHIKYVFQIMYAQLPLFNVCAELARFNIKMPFEQITGGTEN
jgi:hypothetical protein